MPHKIVGYFSIKEFSTRSAIPEPVVTVYDTPGDAKDSHCVKYFSLHIYNKGLYAILRPYSKIDCTSANNCWQEVFNVASTAARIKPRSNKVFKFSAGSRYSDNSLKISHRDKPSFINTFSEFLRKDAPQVRSLQAELSEKGKYIALLEKAIFNNGGSQDDLMKKLQEVVLKKGIAYVEKGCCIICQEEDAPPVSTSVQQNIVKCKCNITVCSQCEDSLLTWYVERGCPLCRRGI